MNRDLAQRLDCLYRRVQDRYKTTETLFTQLIDRANAEEKYTKHLESISASMQNGGGDIDDLIKGVKVDLNQRSQYCKVIYPLSQQFTVAFRHDLENGIQELKAVQTQWKSTTTEVLKQDRELKMAFDKYERQKEKTLKSSRDYEEAAITLEATMWNKESVQESKTKALHKLSQQLQFKSDNEVNLKSVANSYNNQVNAFNTLLQSSITYFQQQFTWLFALAKDMVMKTLVYEISKTRNLQYDSEQFFKEAEKYDDPQSDATILGQGSQLGLCSVKEVFQKVPLQVQSSFLKGIADDISLSHKMNIKVAEHNEDFSYIQNDQLMSDLKQQCIKLVQKVNGHQAEKSNDPLQRDLSLNGLLTKHKVGYPEEELQKIAQVMKYCVQQSRNEPITNWKSVSSEISLSEVLQRRLHREIGVIVLESFRSAGQQQLLCRCSQLECMPAMVQFTAKLLEATQLHGELVLVKRTLMMLATLHDDKRIFLQDALQSLPLWRQLDLWEGLIFVSIAEDIDKSASISREQIFKDKNVIFSTLYAQTLTMINYKIEKNDIKNILTRYARVFQLYELQLQELISFVENDGKIDINMKVNSLSVLSTLYANPVPEQKTGNQFVQKKILIFEKKPAPQQQQRAQTIISQPEYQDQTSPQQQSITQSQSQNNISKKPQSQPSTPLQSEVQQQQQPQSQQQIQQQQPQTQAQTLEEQQDKKKQYSQHPLEVPRGAFLKKIQ